MGEDEGSTFYVRLGADVLGVTSYLLHDLGDFNLLVLDHVCPVWCLISSELYDHPLDGWIVLSCVMDSSQESLDSYN